MKEALFFTVGCLIAVIVFTVVYFRTRKKKRRIVLSSNSEQPKFIPKEPKETKYPLFIPFNEYKGFWPGLHYQTKNYLLSKGKAGVKPEKWNDIFK